MRAVLDTAPKRLIARPADRPLARRPLAPTPAHPALPRSTRTSLTAHGSPPRPQSGAGRRRGLHGRRPRAGRLRHLRRLDVLPTNRAAQDRRGNPIAVPARFRRLAHPPDRPVQPGPPRPPQRRPPLRPERAALQPVPRPRPAIFLRLFSPAATRPWRRRRPPRSATSPPSCCSTGPAWRCSISAAAGAAWR